MRLILLCFFLVLRVLGDNCFFDTKCDISLNRCFKYVSSPATYSDAEETCIKEGGHLVSIENGFVEAVIAESATHAFDMPNFSDFWIGANFIFNNRWSWTDGTEFSYSNWAPGEPLHNETAAVQLKTKFWVNSDPSFLKPFVCEVSLQSEKASTPISCPQTGQCDWGWTRFRNFCYKSFFNLSFASAEATCKQYGAHLTSIHSDEENIFVNGVAARGQAAVSAYDPTWIGMYRLDASSHWLWTDGTEVDYTAWIVAEEKLPNSNGDCALPHIPMQKKLVSMREVIWYRLKMVSLGATIEESAKHAFSVPNLSEFWIGANFIFNNRWSWTDGTEFSYSKWAPGEPLHDQAAAVQLESSYWVNADPSISKPFVCEISMQSQPTPTSCPKTRECDLGWIRLHDFCYKQFFRATFSFAEAYCKQHGAHLASIHGDEENNFVNEIAARGQPPKDAYDLTWIGMYRLDESSTWLWTDGTEVNYTTWINGVPNNPDTYNCIQTFPDGWVTGERRNTWNNWRCEDLIRNFVCKKLL